MSDKIPLRDDSTSIKPRLITLATNDDSNPFGYRFKVDYFALIHREDAAVFCYTWDAAVGHATRVANQQKARLDQMAAAHIASQTGEAA